MVRSSYLNFENLSFLFSMNIYFTELTNKEDARTEVFTAVRRCEYIQSHAYPDEVFAEADPDDNNSSIDSITNEFDV